MKKLNLVSVIWKKWKDTAQKIAGVQIDLLLTLFYFLIVGSLNFFTKILSKDILKKGDFFSLWIEK